MNTIAQKADVGTATATATATPRVPATGALIGGMLLAVIVVVSIAAPAISPYDPEAYQLTAMLQPPSLAHPFGTDEIGRDVLSRVIWGGRPVLITTVAATLLSLLIGLVMGAVGSTGRIADTVITRIADIQLSIPGLVFALLAIALTGPYLGNIIVVLALAAWPLHFRVVRAHAATVRGLPFTEASKLARSSAWYRITRNYLPGVLPLLSVTTGITATVVALSATGLSYLGLGVVLPDWGRMIAISKGHLSDAPWASGFPSVALVVFLLAVQLIAAAVSGRARISLQRSNGV